MGKSVYIAEKPSVAQEFAKALHLNLKRKDGYLESDEAIITWCVGHLVTMSYPEVYDEKYKRWSLQTLPFIPQEFLYEVIPGVKKQFEIVKGILTRKDVDRIYVCTDSGREGEYIYRLVEQMAGVKGKERRRVWIDSQTEEEILRGIREAKDLSEYDNLSASAYLRAKEDYLMGINFSRLLTLKYGNSISNYLGNKYTVVSVGRVMTCVLGMVVRREREIREFVKTPFYRVIESVNVDGHTFTGEWRAVKGSAYFESPKLYKENGFKEKEEAKKLIAVLKEGTSPLTCRIVSIEKKKEKKKKEKAPKQPKEKKVKPKKEKKPKPPAEPDNTPPLPKRPVIAIVLMAVSLFAFVMIVTNLLGYQANLSQAKEKYEQGSYVEAYSKLQGLSIKERDEKLYHQLATLAAVSEKYQAYLVFDNYGSKIDALDALVCAYGRYDLNQKNAKEYGCEDQLEKIGGKIIKALLKDYDMTGDEALDIYQTRKRDDYTVKLHQKLKELGLG